MAVPLRDKFYGCICGAHIGSSMGAPVEGMGYAEIEARYGTVDSLMPYEHYGNGWVRPGGTTEDGVERQKHLITAIAKKGGRVTSEDVRAVWVIDIREDAPGNISEPFEGTLLALAKTGIPASDIGKYCDYAGLNSFARACHPIGLINAGDPEGAAEDALEVGRLYQTAGSRGLRWALVTAVAIAEATRPGATVESVLGSIRSHCDPQVAGEIDRGLALTESCADFRGLREAFDPIYNGVGMPYAMSFANEVVTKAICAFRLSGGNVRDAIVASVNMGRDTDCAAAIAAGIAGALTGADSVPAEWIERVDAAARENPFTSSKRTLRETSDALYGAFAARLRRERAYFNEMERA